MAGILDLFKNIADFYTPKQGEPTLGESARIIGNNMKRKAQDKLYGFHQFDTPIQTAYGEAVDSGSLDEQFNRAWNEKKQSLAEQYNATQQPVEQDVLGEQEQNVQFYDGPPQVKLPKVNEFMTKKYPGTRITQEYYNALENSLDPETLKRAMAMSIAETGAGRDASSFRGDGTKKKYNFYGIHKAWKNAEGKSMPANQYDPDLPTMIEDLKKNFGPGGRYSTINKETLAWYVRGRNYKDLDKSGKASVDAEYSRYLWARKQID